ncbi:MAG: efflux RND transporter periplasmic adaptor subunit [Burkholderiales bacterium]
MNAKMIKIAAVILLVLVALTAGWWFGRTHPAQPARSITPAAQAVNGVEQDKSGRKVSYWFDPMLPQQKFDKSGMSPMNMQLVPKYADEKSDGMVSISSQTQQNLGIRLARVERGKFAEALSAVATVRVDERRLVAVQSRVSGFIERLYVKAVGDLVSRGQRVADIYSPELLAAQQELLALQRISDLSDGDRVHLAARERLRLLGMAEKDVERIIATGQPQRTIGLYANNSGIVQEITLREGGAISNGAPLMQLADLSSVWLVADVPESAMQTLRPGLGVQASFAAFPGEMIPGRIDYVVPGLDPATRTVKVRIVVANPKGRLSPGMFAQVSIRYQEHDVLAVPTEAIIVTGSRKVVIVKEGEGFRPADIETGIEQSNRTEVLKGLKDGEQVVASGQFLIDSEASLSSVLARISTQTTTAAAPAVDKPSPVVHRGRGVVRSVDKQANRIMLEHEAIASLKWSAMTMGFKLVDAQAANGLKPGDQVEFELKDQPEGGDYVIVRLRKAGAAQ